MVKLIVSSLILTGFINKPEPNGLAVIESGWNIFGSKKDSPRMFKLLSSNIIENDLLLVFIMSPLLSL